MAKYMEREEAIRTALRAIVDVLDVHNTVQAIKIANRMREIPTTDAVEVKRGYWEEYWDDDYMESFHRCSECRNDAPAKRDTYCDQVLTNYCPNCGAKMDLKEGDENDL